MRLSRVRGQSTSVVTVVVSVWPTVTVMFSVTGWMVTPRRAVTACVRCSVDNVALPVLPLGAGAAAVPVEGAAEGAGAVLEAAGAELEGAGAGRAAGGGAVAGAGAVLVLVL